jgi:hypothetical protein
MPTETSDDLNLRRNDLNLTPMDLGERSPDVAARSPDLEPARNLDTLDID